MQSRNSSLKQLAEGNVHFDKRRAIFRAQRRAADRFNAVTQEMAEQNGNKAHIESYIVAGSGRLRCFSSYDLCVEHLVSSYVSN